MLSFGSRLQVTMQVDHGIEFGNQSTLLLLLHVAQELVLCGQTSFLCHDAYQLEIISSCHEALIISMDKRCGGEKVVCPHETTQALSYLKS